MPKHEKFTSGISTSCKRKDFWDCLGEQYKQWCCLTFIHYDRSWFLSLSCFYRISWKSNLWFLASLSRLVLNKWKGWHRSYREWGPVPHGQSREEQNWGRLASKLLPGSREPSTRQMIQPAVGLSWGLCCLHLVQHYLRVSSSLRLLHSLQSRFLRE